jgi:RHS repeat-associated protein
MTRIPKPADPTAYFTATYDAWNRLVKIEEDSTTVAEYAYDGAKRRTVKKTYTGGQLQETRHFYYTEPSRWQVLEERLDSSSNPDRQFLWGLRYIDDLLLRDRDTSTPKNGTLNERLYALQDANWNVTAIAATDGAIQERYAYPAYGSVVALTAWFRNSVCSGYDWQRTSTGRRLESEVHVLYYRERYYDAELGSFLSRDPVIDAASVGIDPHAYRFCLNAPVNRRDPLGMWRDWLDKLWWWITTWGKSCSDAAGVAECAPGGARLGILGVLQKRAIRLEALYGQDDPRTKAAWKRFHDARDKLYDDVNECLDEVCPPCKRK